MVYPLEKGERKPLWRKDLRRKIARKIDVSSYAATTYDKSERKRYAKSKKNFFGMGFAHGKLSVL